MSARYPVRVPLDSDAPLLGEIVGLGDGQPGLRRRLDPAFAADAKTRDAFLAEIHALARIPKGSARLVPLVDANVEKDLWLVREYSEEGTVEALLRQGPLSGGELLGLVEMVALGLEELDRLGLAHGDPSPANLLLTRTGRARLADPVSSRRAFAEAAGEGGALAIRDRERVVSWLACAAAESAEEDPLSAELRERLTAPADVALVRARRLAEERAAELRPLRRPSSISLEKAPAAPLAPIKVVISAGPFTVPRVAYQAARAVAEATREPFESVKREIETGTKTFTTEWPEPARAVVEATTRLGARIDVRPAEAAKEGLP